MKHNKEDIKKGETVILDKEFANSSKVIIHDFTPNEMFATVYSADEVYGDMWQVATYRLTKIK